MTGAARPLATLALLVAAGCGRGDVVTMRPGVNPPIIVGARVLEPEIVRAYLRDSVGVRGPAGTTPTCAYSLLGAEGSRAFVWALCRGPGGPDGASSGISLPIALRVDASGPEARIVGHDRPRDGDRFRADLDSLFPPGVAGVALQRGRLAEERLASLDSALRADTAR